MKSAILATALGATLTTAAFAEPVAYAIDTDHTQIVFNYMHQGWTPNFGMFSEISGEISFDAEDPAASSVTVSFPISTFIAGNAGRKGHLLSADFFNADTNPDVTFVSTSIEVTGDTTALITGDLTIAGVTKPVVLDTVMNQIGEDMMSGAPAIGLSATTQVLRSDFGVGAFAPVVSDEVEITISVEAKAS